MIALSAGLSPSRRPAARAKSSTVSMRPRAARRHRLGADQRLESLEHQPAVDRRNGKIAEHWIGIAGKRGQPFLAVLGVAPLARVNGKVVLRALPERHLLGPLSPSGERGTVASLDRVDATGKLYVAIVPQLSRQRE